MRQRAGRRVSWWLAFAMLLGACGDSTIAAPVVVLRVLMADDWATVDPVLDAVRDFERSHPGVRVRVEGVPFASIPTTVDASIRAGDPYDLAQWHAFAAGAIGMGEPVDDLWAATLDDGEFLPGAIDDVEWAGVRYGVPLDTNAMVLVANAELLREAGISPDDLTTFEGLFGAAQLLSSDEGSRRGMAHSLSTWSAYGWIRANGGEVVRISDDGSPTFLFDDPATVGALDFLGRTVRHGIAHAPGARNRSVEMVDLFLEGNAAFIATGGWDLVDAGRADGSIEAVALPVPSGPSGAERGTALGGSSLFVPAGSDQRELAFAFATSLIEDERAVALATNHGRLPVRRRVFEDAAFDNPTMQVVKDHLQVATPMKLIAFEEAQEAFSRALESVLTGQRTAAEALAEAQRLAESSVGQGAGT